MAREMASRARISSCLTQETNDWPQDDTCETCSLSSRTRFISTVVQILGQRLAMSSPCQPLNPTRQNFALLKISKLIVLWNEKISPCSSLTPLNPSTHQEAGFTPTVQNLVLRVKMAQILSPVRMEALKFQHPVLNQASRIPSFSRTSSSWNLIGRGANRRAFSRIKVATEDSSSVADDYYAVLGLVMFRSLYVFLLRDRCLQGIRGYGYTNQTLFIAKGHEISRSCSGIDAVNKNLLAGLTLFLVAFFILGFFPCDLSCLSYLASRCHPGSD